MSLDGESELWLVDETAWVVATEITLNRQQAVTHQQQPRWIVSAVQPKRTFVAALVLLKSGIARVRQKRRTAIGLARGA